MVDGWRSEEDMPAGDRQLVRKDLQEFLRQTTRMTKQLGGEGRGG
jgi:hypothetical protein